MATPEPSLPDAVRRVLAHSFFIRTTMRGRRSGRLRTVETTYVWDGGRKLCISGYPGKRDWVANLAAHPDVTVHTVEGERTYDIAGTARVLRDPEERAPHLFDFIDHWASRGSGPFCVLRLFVRLARCNRQLHLPWWGPFFLFRRILDRMPCVEITLEGDARLRPGGPPPPTAQPRP